MSVNSSLRPDGNGRIPETGQQSAAVTRLLRQQIIGHRTFRVDFLYRSEAERLGEAISRVAYIWLLVNDFFERAYHSAACCLANRGDLLRLRSGY